MALVINNEEIAEAVRECVLGLDVHSRFEEFQDLRHMLGRTEPGDEMVTLMAMDRETLKNVVTIAVIGVTVLLGTAVEMAADAARRN